MSNFQLGSKALKALVEGGNGLDYWRAKLSPQLFRGDEQAIYAFVQQHYEQYKVLPKPETVYAQFPELAEVQCPEVPAYYVDKLEKRFGYEVIRRANLDSQEALQKDQNSCDKAEEILRTALQELLRQRYRHKLTDFGTEAQSLLLRAYYKQDQPCDPLMFGWPYMDERTGGLLPGDVVSFCGRPATGKSWLTLYLSVTNWLLGRNVLFVSMEMATLAICQRLAAMYTHLPVDQLKLSGFSSASMKAFASRIGQASNEKGKLYVVDGNLAAHVHDVYELAEHLGCHGVVIDGAYLMRHPNPRMNRFERVAENVELMKRSTINMPTVASWQFNRQASQKHKKTAGEKDSLETIGYSDAIGQISSIVLGLMQEDTVETLEKRHIDLLKGRNGEVGGFDIKWDFASMAFDQQLAEAEADVPLEYL